MKDICVVYLVRAQNSIEPFMRFLESYQLNPGDIAHDFLLIFKGFEHSSDKDAYFKLLAPFQYLSFDVPDIGFDITAYFSVARHYVGRYQYFCFLNSFSVIQCSDWLSKLYKYISLPQVGLVGATGSWQSHNAWGQIIKARKMRVSCFPVFEKVSILNHINNRLRAIWRNFYLLVFFSPFPNYHVRTNAFMLSSELMNNLVLPTIKTKIDAYKFESGRKGLTQQILNMGKEVLVVGKDGIGYDMKLWGQSNTFWQANQENLLIADNQTGCYQNGTLEQRRYLSFRAWGN